MKNERRFMRGANALLPGRGFETQLLHAPQQAVIAFLSAVPLRPLGAEEVDIDDASGRFLAGDITAREDVPLVARSTMDGFAIASAQTPGTFRVVGVARISKPWPERLVTGEALQVPTGGVIPHGGDCVVPIEDSNAKDGTITVDRALLPRDCIAAAGEDIAAGTLVLPAGRRVGAPEISVLATLGYARVPVFQQPLFGVLSGGDELIEVRESVTPGKVRDSNRYAVAAALRAMGARVRHFPIVRDDERECARALRDALEQCDALAMSGGSSVGQLDFTPRAIASLGSPGVVVHGLRVKPGKPTVLGGAGGKPVLGLPGNPASALMILLAVGAPIVAALTGARRRESEVAFPLGAPVDKRAGWTWFLPVTLQEADGRCVAMPLPMRSSWSSLLARSAGFIVLGEDIEHVDAGTEVGVRFFREAY